MSLYAATETNYRDYNLNAWPNHCYLIFFMKKQKFNDKNATNKELHNDVFTCRPACISKYFVTHNCGNMITGYLNGHLLILTLTSKVKTAQSP